MNVKCCQLRYNTSSVLTRRRFPIPEKAIIRREGAKAIDNAEIYFSSEVKMEEGDEIYYIQDVVDVDDLKGIWNFWGSFRDESGYHNDDYVSGTYTLPACVNETEVMGSSRFRGKICLQIDARTDDGVKIPNKQNSNSLPTLDMSGDFDIYFWFQSLTNQTATLFEKHNSSTGIKVQVNSTTDVVTVTCNSTTITTTGSSTHGVDFRNDPVLLRVCRSGNSVKTYLNNQLVGTGTVSATMNTTSDLYLFKEFDSSYTGTGFYGRAFQLRWYDKCFDDSSAESIYIAKPQSQTMKFGGKVWKIEKDAHICKIVCNGFSSFLLNTHANSSKISGNVTLANGATRTNNIYKRSGNNRIRLDEIIPDIIKETTNTNEFLTSLIDTGSTSLQADFVAEGIVLELINILLQVKGNNTLFTISPRKVFLVVRENTGDMLKTNMIFTDSTYRLLNKGQDSTGTVNYLIGFGDLSIKTHSTSTVRNQADSGNEYLIGIGTTDDTWSTNGYKITGIHGYEAFPISIIKVERGDYDGGVVTGLFTPEVELTQALSTLTGTTDATHTYSAIGNVYYLNKNTNKIYFSSHEDYSDRDYRVTFQYKYETSPTGIARGVSFAKDDNSINTNGTYMKKFQAPQLRDDTGLERDLTTLTSNLIADRKDIKQRIRVFTKQLINSVIEGDYVQVFYPTFNIGSQDANSSVTTESYTIKSIEWRFPEGTTIIELGDFVYTSFDLEKVTSEAIRQVVSVSGEGNI
tara:strand:+ start:6753 stop:8984 length:2232 start_codon:yes stop_codon:yes gene_type:complete